MSNRHLQIGAVLCILFCLGSLVQQVFFLLHMDAPDPHLATFAAEYRVTSSIETAIIVSVGLGLSALVFARPTTMRGLLVGAFCLFIIWKRYFSNLGIFFRHGISDGLLTGAAIVWWRLHAPHIGIYVFSFVVLLSSCAFTFVGSYALRNRNKIT